jgi:mono/diheme cytochrome c family protein
MDVGRRPVPVWLILLLFLLIYWGMVYFDECGGWFAQEVYIPYRSLDEVQRYQPPSGDDTARGKAMFENVCAVCHNSDGSGKPGQAPPFVRSEWVTSSPDRIIRIPLVGLSGPIQVNGLEYNLSMPAMGAGLKDDELAAVLTYIRQTWGSKDSKITPAQVAAVRAVVGNRTQPWAAAELLSIP